LKLCSLKLIIKMKVAVLAAIGAAVAFAQSPNYPSE
jgi:hypothetical protein